MAEFQAVIMAAGRGSRMYPLTENFPKSILPVCNLPLILYPLNLLEKSGFEEVIVVVLESEEMLIRQAISTHCETEMEIDIVSIADNTAMGTADSLRQIKDKIKRDVIVVSCDLIADVKLHQLADVHRTYDASISVLLTSNENREKEQQDVKTKAKKDSQSQRDIVGLDEHQNRLLFLDAEDDLDESLIVHKSLLKREFKRRQVRKMMHAGIYEKVFGRTFKAKPRFPCVNIKGNLVDAHLYIIKKWVIDFLASNKSINSIKGELIPYLIKRQYRGRRQLGEGGSSQDDTKNDIFNFIEKNELEELSQSLSTSDRTCKDDIRCHCYIMDSGLCLRINTLPVFMESNRLIPKMLPTLSRKELVHPLANVKKSQVGSDSMVGEGSNISEKVSIKKSIIGKHVIIGEKVKITNSVLMDHVIIKDGCNIQGSVICNNALINENSTLKDCQVGESHTIPEGSDLKGEAFTQGHMNI